jgi:hypothetical protein
MPSPVASASCLLPLISLLTSVGRGLRGIFFFQTSGQSQGVLWHGFGITLLSGRMCDDCQNGCILDGELLLITGVFLQAVFATGD